MDIWNQAPGSIKKKIISSTVFVGHCTFQALNSSPNFTSKLTNYCFQLCQLFYFEINHSSLQNSKVVLFSEKKKKKALLFSTFTLSVQVLPKTKSFLVLLQNQKITLHRKTFSLLNGLNSKVQLNNYCKYTDKFISSKSNVQVAADQFSLLFRLHSMLIPLQHQ